MSKTQLSGGRIRKKSISYEHFVDGIKIPETNLTLNYPTHIHANKEVIDRIRYTGTQENVDLRDIELLMIEVVAARRNGNNLGGTIDEKADKASVEALVREFNLARGDYETLADAIRAYGISVDDKLNAHIGVISHPDIDNMYTDYIAAKNGLSSLAERLNQIGDGSGGGGGVVINTLYPWTYRYTTVADETTGLVSRNIPIPYSFVPNANTIQVFEGPLCMLPGAAGDYLEHEDSSITFNYDLPAGVVITVVGVTAGTLYLWKQVFKTTKNQQVFHTLDSYNVGTDELQVYESGLLLVKGVDYIEIDNNTITFLYPLPEDLEVIICRRR